MEQVLEGSTDLAVLLAFAEILTHPARTALESPFVIYVANGPGKVQRHFYALREANVEWSASPCSTGWIERRAIPDWKTLVWSRRGIENHLIGPDVLEVWAMNEEPAFTVRGMRVDTMRAIIAEIEAAQRSLAARLGPWASRPPTMCWTLFSRNILLP
jgi:hypothetical protein